MNSEECTCHLGHPPCSYCTDTPLEEEEEEEQMDNNPLDQLFAEFWSEYGKEYNKPKTKGVGEFLFYFTMSEETFKDLYNHPENKPSRQQGTYIYSGAYNFFKLKLKVMGRLINNVGGYWQVPIAQADLPKGKVFLRKIGKEEKCQ